MSVDVGRQRALLAWYEQAQRALPWRARAGLADAYQVLVSESMLQQTRVEAVRGYYARWMERFPTIAALAAADVDDAIAAWAGLGYYRRARSLHAAARLVVERHGGEIPQELAVLRALPGVGPYTAGALASLAFGQPAPLVDGNVARVLARWDAWGEVIDAPAAQRRLWQRASDELALGLPAAAAPQAWNQALMELGALVCTPGQPACAACPVATSCQARAAGLAAELPRRAARRPPKDVEAWGFVAWRGAGVSLEVLLARRPPRGPWAGLWQPPMAEDGNTAAAMRAALGPAMATARRLAPLLHLLTHRRYLVEVDVIVTGAAGVLAAEAAAAASPAAAWAWLPVAEQAGGTRGISRLGARILDAALPVAAAADVARQRGGDGEGGRGAVAGQSP